MQHNYFFLDNNTRILTMVSRGLRLSIPWLRREPDTMPTHRAPDMDRGEMDEQAWDFALSRLAASKNTIRIRRDEQQETLFVYLIFGKEEADVRDLLYVGMTDGPRRRWAHHLRAAEWANLADEMVAIPVRRSKAQSLEALLISVYQPRYNKHGRSPAKDHEYLSLWRMFDRLRQIERAHDLVEE